MRASGEGVKLTRSQMSRRWQIKQNEKGLCRKCKDGAIFRAGLCEKHYIRDSAYKVFMYRKKSKLGRINGSKYIEGEKK